MAKTFPILGTTLSRFFVFLNYNFVSVKLNVFWLGSPLMYIFIIHIHYTVLCIESFALTGPGKVLSQYLIAVLYTTVMNQLKRTVSRKKFGFYFCII